jgi:phospholipid-binding lipoprotein MlaA
VTVPDPLEPFNGAIYKFNDFLILYVLEPVAKVEKAVVPWELRTILRNMLQNLRFPVRFVNCLLQAKWEKSGDEFASFFLNTTAGFLGMADVAATYPGLQRSPEDMGQTFAVWGWQPSSYLMLPFFGPSTIRMGWANGDLGSTPVLADPDPEAIACGREAVNDTSFRSATTTPSKASLIASRSATATSKPAKADRRVAVAAAPCDLIFRPFR